MESVDGKMSLYFWSRTMKLLKKSKMITAAISGFVVLVLITVAQPTLANTSIHIGYNDWGWHHHHQRYDYGYRANWHQYWRPGFYDSYGFWHPGHWVRHWS